MNHLSPSEVLGLCMAAYGIGAGSMLLGLVAAAALGGRRVARWLLVGR